MWGTFWFSMNIRCNFSVASWLSLATSAHRWRYCTRRPWVSRCRFNLGNSPDDHSADVVAPGRVETSTTRSTASTAKRKFVSTICALTSSRYLRLATSSSPSSAISTGRVETRKPASSTEKSLPPLQLVISTAMYSSIVGHREASVSAILRLYFSLRCALPGFALRCRRLAQMAYLRRSSRIGTRCTSVRRLSCCSLPVYPSRPSSRARWNWHTYWSNVDLPCPGPPTSRALPSQSGCSSAWAAPVTIWASALSAPSTSPGHSSAIRCMSSATLASGRQANGTSTNIESTLGPLRSTCSNSTLSSMPYCCAL